MKVAMAASWPAWARCSSSTEPSPRPCWWSSMTNATSAAVAGIEPVVAGHADELVVEQGDEREPIDVVEDA